MGIVVLHVLLKILVAEIAQMLIIVSLVMLEECILDRIIAACQRLLMDMSIFKELHNLVRILQRIVQHVL
jgi:hypothetical protein